MIADFPPLMEVAEVVSIDAGPDGSMRRRFEGLVLACLIWEICLL